MKSLNRQEIKNLLNSHGLKGSVQRIGIYEYLSRQTSHPTVDVIYKALVDEIPTLSKTTVYNTLKQLTDVGMVSMLTIEENENRYDADLSDHGHFKCIRCNRVIDIDLNHCQLCDEKLADHQVMQRHVYFRGICQSCSNETI